MPFLPFLDHLDYTCCNLCCAAIFPSQSPVLPAAGILLVCHFRPFTTVTSMHLSFLLFCFSFCHPIYLLDSRQSLKKYCSREREKHFPLGGRCPDPPRQGPRCCKWMVLTQASSSSLSMWPFPYTSALHCQLSLTTSEGLILSRFPQVTVADASLSTQDCEIPVSGIQREVTSQTWRLPEVTMACKL